MKILLLSALMASACSLYAQDNALTKEEKAQGYRLLFNGESLKGWHTYLKTKPNDQWKVDSGTIHLAAKGGGDLTSDKEYQNFELAFDWKIAPGGNSGAFYNVVEMPEYKHTFVTAPEYQLLDDERHKDNALKSHRTAANYDLIAPDSAAKNLNPAGQWNSSMIYVSNGQVEHWLNGRKVVSYTLWSPEWTQMVAGSKFKSMPAYGLAKKGHIAFQDHGDQVWLKNVKIREVK